MKFLKWNIRQVYIELVLLITQIHQQYLIGKLLMVLTQILHYQNLIFNHNMYSNPDNKITLALTLPLFV